MQILTVDQAPSRSAILGNIDNALLIGGRRITCPEPYGIVLLRQRERPQSCRWRDRRLAGDADAFPRTVILHAVIAALDHIANELAARERCELVRATVNERHRRPVFLAKHDNGLAQDAPRHERASELTAPCYDIPSIADEPSVLTAHRHHPRRSGRVLHETQHSSHAREHWVSL